MAYDVTSVGQNVDSLDGKVSLCESTLTALLFASSYDCRNMAPECGSFEGGAVQSMMMRLDRAEATLTAAPARHFKPRPGLPGNLGGLHTNAPAWQGFPEMNGFPPNTM